MNQITALKYSTIREIHKIKEKLKTNIIEGSVPKVFLDNMTEASVMLRSNILFSELISEIRSSEIGVGGDQ